MGSMKSRLQRISNESLILSIVSLLLVLLAGSTLYFSRFANAAYPQLSAERAAKQFNVGEAPRIYMYDLGDAMTHEQFNDWYAFIKSESVMSGFGRHASWDQDSPNLYQTNQFALDLIIHHKILHSPYLVATPAEANLFYVPLFLGSMFRLARSYTHPDLPKKEQDAWRDTKFFDLVVPMLDHLQQSEHFQRHGGKDHFTVSGRISKEITRLFDGLPTDHSLRVLAQDDGIRVFSIETDDQASQNWVTLPYPAHTHFINDRGLEVDTTAKTTLSCGTWTLRYPFRLLLKSLCQAESRDVCHFYDNRGYNNTLLADMYRDSVFCIQPHGDTATRGSWYDCMQAVTIPVAFDPKVPLPFEQHIDWYNDIVVYIPREEIENNSTSLFEVLSHMPQSEIERRQNNIRRYREMLQYTIGSSDHHDAFHYMLTDLCSSTGKCRTS